MKEVPFGESTRHLLFFGDLSSHFYAVNALTGEEVWKKKVDDQLISMITGSPVIHDDKIFVPISAGVESHGATSAIDYSCCRSRGGIVALSMRTGETIWKTWTLEKAKLIKVDPKTKKEWWGPSGASVWHSPTLSPQGDFLYVGTGQASAPPIDKNHNSLLALETATGQIVWSKNVTPGDVWNWSCMEKEGKDGNCAFFPGEGLDVVAPILTISEHGRSELLVSGKDGVLRKLDVKRNGEVLWEQKVSASGILGGVHWGFAADGQAVFLPINGRFKTLSIEYGEISYKIEQEAGALVSVDQESGEILWKFRPQIKSCLQDSRSEEQQKQCSLGYSAAVASTADIVVAGALDGFIRVHSKQNGEVLWQFDTVKEFRAVNLNDESSKAFGGSIDGAGPIMVDGMLFVNSGYSMFDQMPGNVLLAFSSQ